MKANEHGSEHASPRDSRGPGRFTASGMSGRGVAACGAVARSACFALNIAGRVARLWRFFLCLLLVGILTGCAGDYYGYVGPTWYGPDYDDYYGDYYDPGFYGGFWGADHHPFGRHEHGGWDRDFGRRGFLSRQAGGRVGGGFRGGGGFHGGGFGHGGGGGSHGGGGGSHGGGGHGR